LVFVGDGSFAVLDLLSCVSSMPNTSLITRLRIDAELWNPAPERKPRQNGRPRVKGARRPSPQQRLDDPKTQWTELEVEHWYGVGKRKLEIYTETCVWYKSGHEPVLIRWVLACAPQGEFDPQAFVSTNPDHTPLQILTWFVRRWRMEMCQSQPIKLTWSPLMLFRLATDSLRGRFKRENEMDVNFFSSNNGLADQALSYDLTIFKRELFEILTEQSMEGLGVVNYLLPMNRLLLCGG
jgi:hypothetical protein